VDCTALDKAGCAPLEWAICLINTRAPVNKKEQPPEPPQRNIDEIMEFIDGGHRGGAAGEEHRRGNRPRKKKSSKDKDSLSLDSGGGCVSPSSPSGGGSAFGASQEATATTGDGALPLAGGCAAADEQLVDGRLPPDLTPDGMEDEETAPPRPTELASTPSEPPPEPKSEPERCPLHDDRDPIDTDLMSELLRKYQQLVQMSQRLELDTKITTVKELLEVLDEIEAQIEGSTCLVGTPADIVVAEEPRAARALLTVAGKFEAKLRGLGLARMETLGRPFDQRLHSLATERQPGGCDGEVILEELESGWVLGDAVVRPALVRVG